jgi:hypothetical protein
MDGILAQNRFAMRDGAAGLSAERVLSGATLATRTSDRLSVTSGARRRSA